MFLTALSSFIVWFFIWPALWFVTSSKVWYNDFREYCSHFYISELETEDGKLFLTLGDRKVYLDKSDNNTSMISQEVFGSSWMCTNDGFFERLSRFQLIKLLADEEQAYTIIRGYDVKLSLERAMIYKGIKIGSYYFTDREDEKPMVWKEVICEEGEQE